MVSGASPHSEFLAAGREGIHHVRYPVQDLAATLAALEPEGFVPIWSHAIGPYRWAYCEHHSRYASGSISRRVSFKRRMRQRPARLMYSSW